MKRRTCCVGTGLDQSTRDVKVLFFREVLVLFLGEELGHEAGLLGACLDPFTKGGELLPVDFNGRDCQYNLSRDSRI